MHEVLKGNWKVEHEESAQEDSPLRKQDLASWYEVPHSEAAQRGPSLPECTHFTKGIECFH